MFRKALIAACALAVFSSSAMAQTWGAPPAPRTLNNGTPYCMLWHGNSAPMMNLTVTPSQHLLNVKADQFLSLEDRTNGFLTFPSGQNSTEAPFRTGRDGMVAMGLSEASFDFILQQLYTNGEFRITVGGIGVGFPVSDMQERIETFKSCLAQLPAVELAR